jgi:large repetitive protein
VAGSSFSTTLTAKDAFGNTATGYNGVVQFTSADGQAVLPANYTFTAGDGGVHVFTATLKTPGSESITARDAITGSVTGNAIVSVMPSSNLTAFAVGQDAGGSSQVITYNPAGSLVSTFNPFPATSGGVRTAMADFNGDGTQDLAVGTGPGAVAEVKVLDGKTGAVLFDVMPFDQFTGGVFVAAGNITGNGNADLVISPDLSGGPRIEVYEGGDFHEVANYFGINDPDFRGGARVGVGDLSGDGHADLVVSAGFGGGPRISVYDGKALLQGQLVHLIPDFFAFEPSLRNGAYVAAGDVNGDGTNDLIFGAGPGGAPRVLIVSGQTLLSAGSTAAINTPVANFFAGNVNNRGGVRVAAKNLDGDRFADVLTGAGTGGSGITAHLGQNLTLGDMSNDFAFDAFPGFTGGVFVG